MVAAEQARQLQMARGRAGADRRSSTASRSSRRSTRSSASRPSRRRRDTVVAPPSTHGGVVGVALSQLGTPYVWGGAAPGGFDCSGLVMWAYAQVGVSLPHSTYAQYGMRRPGLARPAAARRPRLLRRPRPRRHLHRRRPVRARAAHRRRREDLEPRRGLVLVDLRRRPPHPLAVRERVSRTAPATSAAKWSSTTLRRSFSVGVISSCSSVNSRGRIAKRLICSKRERSAFTASTARCTSACASSPFATSGSSVISAAMYGLRSPTTSACETIVCAFSSFSRFCGATFLPPAVTMMSFLRSVITRNPSSSRWPTSPVCTKPSSSSTSRVASGVVVVAGEDGVRADQDLAVLGDPDLDARAAACRPCRT